MKYISSRYLHKLPSKHVIQLILSAEVLDDFHIKAMQKLTDWLSLVCLTIAIHKFLYFWNYAVPKFFNFHIWLKHMISFSHKIWERFWRNIIILSAYRAEWQRKRTHCPNVPHNCYSVVSHGLNHRDKWLSSFFPHCFSKMRESSYNQQWHYTTEFQVYTCATWEDHTTALWEHWFAINANLKVFWTKRH